MARIHHALVLLLVAGSARAGTYGLYTEPLGGFIVMQELNVGSMDPPSAEAAQLKRMEAEAQKRVAADRARLQAVWARFLDGKHTHTHLRHWIDPRRQGSPVTPTMRMPWPPSELRRYTFALQLRRDTPPTLGKLVALQFIAAQLADAPALQLRYSDGGELARELASRDLFYEPWVNGLPVFSRALNSKALLEALAARPLPSVKRISLWEIGPQQLEFFGAWLAKLLVAVRAERPLPAEVLDALEHMEAREAQGAVLLCLGLMTDKQWPTEAPRVVDFVRRHPDAVINAEGDRGGVVGVLLEQLERH